MTHHPLHRLRPTGTALALCLVLLGGTALAQGAGKPTVKPGEPVTLNFVNAEIEAVARTVATLSGANVVVDPRVKGTMSLSSTLPVPPAQALRLFSAQLRTQGFALVENAGIHTVVPEADAKLQSGPVQAGPAATGGGQIPLLPECGAEGIVHLVAPWREPDRFAETLDRPLNLPLAKQDIGEDVAIFAISRTEANGILERRAGLVEP